MSRHSEPRCVPHNVMRHFSAWTMIINRPGNLGGGVGRRGRRGRNAAPGTRAAGQLDRLRLTGSAHDGLLPCVHLLAWQVHGDPAQQHLGFSTSSSAKIAAMPLTYGGDRVGYGYPVDMQLEAGPYDVIR